MNGSSRRPACGDATTSKFGRGRRNRHGPRAAGTLLAAVGAILLALPALAADDRFGPFAPIADTLGAGGGVVEVGTVAVRLLGGAAILVGIVKSAIGRFDTASFLSIFFGFIVLSLGPEFILWAEVSPPAPKLTPLPQSGEPYLCVLCKTFTNFGSTASAFRETAYATLAGPALALAQAIMLMWILAFVGGLFLKPKEGSEAAPRLFVQFGWFGLVAGLLSSPDWLFVNVVGLMEETAVGTAGVLFDAARGTFAAAGGGNSWASISTNQTVDNGVYAYLWGHVEATLYTIVNMMIWQLDRTLSSAGIFAMHALVMALIVIIVLGLPLTFVLGIFAAYLFQTMFYYMAISAVAPALIAGMLFKWSRGYAWAALKFLLGGALTLVFAAVAMSFTGAVIYLGLQGMWDKAAGSGANLVSDALIAAANATNGQPDTVNPLAQTEFASSIFSPLSSSFWITALICWVSVLLHLNAPKIASNISGSNDSATTAALVVAAGQAAVGFAGRAALGTSLQGGGALGAAGAFVSALRGNSSAENPLTGFTSHGLMGMGAEKLGRALHGSASEARGAASSWLRGQYHSHTPGVGPGADGGGGAYSAGSPSPEQTDHMRGFDRS